MTTRTTSKPVKSASASKKLKLNKETLRDLSPKAERQIKGGLPKRCTADQSGC